MKVFSALSLFLGALGVASEAVGEAHQKRRGCVDIPNSVGAG